MYIKYILVLFSFFVLSSSAFAEHEGTNKETIKALVQKVKKAEPSKRRLLMNELKTKLRTMHQETRTQVMLELRRSFNGQHGKQGRKQSNCTVKSNIHNQNTMSMTESKHIQEHMIQSCMCEDRCHTNSTSNIRPPVNTTPMRGM